MIETNSESVGEKIEQTIEAAEEVVRHPLTKIVAQFGFYTKGVLFIVIGILALMVTFGEKGGELADPTGALTTVAQIRYGKILLIIFIVGALGHAAWNILRGAADVDNAGKNWQGIVKRIVAAGVGIFYLFLAFTAWSIVTTAQVSVHNGAVQKTIVGLFLAVPLGAVLVLIIGLVLIGAGFSEAFRGVTGKFQTDFNLREMRGSKQKILTALGALSFTARAVIFGLIGYYFIAAAIESNANDVVGMDGALKILAHSYFGKTFLFFAAVGLMCNGILAFYEARYRRIS